MTLIIKEITITKRDFEEIDIKMQNKIRDINFHGYTSYYNSLKFKGVFKINDKIRNILEVVLLDYS